MHVMRPDIRGAESAVDAEIERLVQRVTDAALRKVRNQKLTLHDAVLALMEATARIGAVGLPPGAEGDRNAAIAADLLRQRFLSVRAGALPGDAAWPDEAGNRPLS